VFKVQRNLKVRQRFGVCLVAICCSLNVEALQWNAEAQPIHPAQQPQYSKPILTTLAPMPIAVQEIYPVLHQGEIYVAGGLSDALPAQDGQMTAAVQIYDLVKNRWRRGPDLPEGRHHAQLVSVGHDLYLLGGFIRTQHAGNDNFWQDGNWQASADILKLAPQATTWQLVGQLPKPLAETVSFVKDQQIHLLGGRSPAGADNSQWQHHLDQDWHWQINPLALPAPDAVTELAKLPVKKNSAAMAVWNQQAWWLGGRNRALGNTAGIAAFDFASRGWLPAAQTPDLPQAQAGLAAAAIGTQICVFGGEGSQEPNNVFHTIWCFTPKTGHWQATGQMQPARHGHGAVAVGNAVYLMGGATVAGLNKTTGLLQRWQLGAK
jgi:hypothetical protein